MKIRSLSGVPFEQIHRAFEAAFSDYIEDVSLSSRQLQEVLERRGFNAQLSFGAFEAGEIVGFIVNGIGMWNNVRTAYDCGTGVIKAFRQQGIASRIFEQSLPVLRQQGISQYLLEVIKTNHGAVELYRKSGFTVSREFDYWVSAAGCLTVPSVALPPGASGHFLGRPTLVAEFDRLGFAEAGSYDPAGRLSGRFHRGLCVHGK
jgi:YD repeat-containing protein